MKKTALLLNAVLASSILLCCGNHQSKIADKKSVEVKKATDEKSTEVKIGDQIWTTENLNVTVFRNGDPIPEAKTAEEWSKAGKEGKPAWCYYENDPANEKKYGKLYNFYAISDPRGLAPTGWHIPTDQEWVQSAKHLGGEEAAGEKMKSITGWKKEGSGTNESGFSGLPGGTRGDAGGFGAIGENGHWWSSSEGDKPNAIMHCMLDYSFRWLIRLDVTKGSGLSVRCVKDK